MTNVTRDQVLAAAEGRTRRTVGAITDIRQTHLSEFRTATSGISEVPADECRHN